MSLYPLPLVTIPAPVLKQRARPVEKITDQTRETLERMVLTMVEHEGTGLAANQVGILERLVVMVNEAEGDQQAILKMINPEIIERSDSKEPFEQGCLSVPGVSASVVRPDWVKFSYLDPQGNKIIAEAKGLMCHCIQHEIDHLDGVLFIDHLSRMKKRLLTQRSLKFQESPQP